jgi:hypothetical protein
MRAGRPLLVLNLAGTQAEMGRQHGELLARAGDYEATVEFYRRMPEILMGKERGGVPEPILRPLVRFALLGLHRGRPPELRERSRAFFEALGYPRRFSHHLFVMDLLQNVIGLAGQFGLGASRRLLASAAIPACSSVAVWGRSSRDGTLRHARNFDFPGTGIWEQQPTVVFNSPDRGLRYGFVATRGADTPGVTAFNEAGLTLGAHTRFHRHVRFSGAGIVDLGHEIIRRAETLADAAKIARERKVASTWGLLVSSAREKSAALLEVTGRAVDVIRPAAGEDFLVQTNRYRSAALREGEVAPMTGFLANSDGRARALRSRVLGGGLDAGDLRAALGGRECPETAEERPCGGVLAQPISVQSVVTEPEARLLHISVGPSPTGLGPWLEVPMKWEGVGSRVALPPPAEPGAGAAHAAFVEVVGLDGRGAPRSEVAAALERVVALDPEEPIYRLLAGALALRGGDAGRAHEHFRRGLVRERAPFRRATLLLWAARAARVAGRVEEARALTAELLAVEHPLAHDLKEQARREGERPLPARKLGRIVINLVFPDVMLT